MNIEKGSRQELAQLLSMVRSHPALPVGLLDGLDSLLAEATPFANPFDSSAGIAIYLDARADLDARIYTEKSS